MKRCAFLTLCERGDFVIDDELAIGPLEALGWKVSTVSWRQADEPWSHFDAVVIRSTWDYWSDMEGFLNTLETINQQTRLANPLSLVKWNLAKTYMKALEDQGIGIVPTLWPQRFEPERFEAWADHLEAHRLVIKPVVGANGDDAFRVVSDTSTEEVRHMAERFRGRDFMVQRFMPAILEEGEFSTFFFGGKYSHAILKTPTGSEFRCQEERGGEIRAVQAEPLLIRRAQQVVDTLQPGPLYARVDFVRETGGDFVVMEVELIEPSMYLRTDERAPRRFARAIDEWFS